MKRLHRQNLRWMIGLGTIVVLATPVFFSKPVMAGLQQVGQTVADNLQREPQVHLTLTAAKQITTTDHTGKSQTGWQSIEGQTVVQPGDRLQYQLSSKNVSDRPARNLVLTQPIPSQMKYVLNSAAVNSATHAATGSEMTFSIDGGQTFVARPTVEVTLPDGTIETRPAPAERYTHIRWKFSSALSAGAEQSAIYHVEVR